VNKISRISLRKKSFFRTRYDAFVNQILDLQKYSSLTFLLPDLEPELHPRTKHFIPNLEFHRETEIIHEKSKKKEVSQFE
jgi:hypothetical protein